MRTRPIQMNFTNGEVSPRLFGRSDLAKYWASLETLENFVILPYGGVARRDGFHHVTSQSDETRKARMIPFIFSTEQAYAIEAGHKYMRFFMNHGLILDDGLGDTVLLLHMHGIDASQTFLDSSNTAHLVTAGNTAQIDTGYWKYGGSAGLFLSADHAFLSVADHANFDFSATNIFTFEQEIYIPGVLADVCIWSKRTDINNQMGVYLWADGHVTFQVVNAGSYQILTTSTGAFTADSWNHIRVVGDGTNYYLFVGGALLDWEVITQSTLAYTGLLYIAGNPVEGSYLNGWMAEFRVSKVARSTSAFAPPTQEFPLPEEIGVDIVPYEIVTPYLESDLPLLKYFQSYDTMYIFHPDHGWRKLGRTAHTVWTLTEVDFTNGPWLNEKDDIVFTPSAITGSIDLVASDAFFLAGHVGALLRLYISEAWGYVKITTVTNTTNAVATVVNQLTSTADSTKYQEGAWSAVRGFPSSGSFNEASLMVAATDHQPQAIWASKKGDFENFEAGALDDQGFSYPIPASNRILWLGALRELVLGTGDGMYKMTGGVDDYISPTNVRVRPGMAIGAKNLGPIAVKNSLLYWQKGSRKLRELTYDPNSYDENYVAPDLSLLADHITLGGIIYSAWQQEPNSILWTVRTDGVLLSMTYMRAEDIVGWGRHITDGVVESVATIPDPTDTFNEVWVSVKRTVIDTPDADTVLCLNMDGEDGSVAFHDSSANEHTVNVYGGAVIDTVVSKFGGASGKFPFGGLGYLTIPDHADFNFSTDDIFTMEFFIYPQLLGSEVIAVQTNGSSYYWQIYTSSGALKFSIANAGAEQIVTTANAALTTGQWNHVRIVGDGTNYYLFVGGELLVTDAIVQGMMNCSSVISIGAYLISGPTLYFTGWLDGFKISKVARSTASFTVPATNTVDRRYIEYMDPDMMVDSGLIYSGGEVSSVSGLDHLEGETVDIVADGVVYTRQVVLNGAVSISPAASKIQVGLPYTSKIVTMKPVASTQAGTSAGLPKKWSEMQVLVYETSGLKINNEVIAFRAFSDVGLGEAIPLYSGEIKVSQLGWNDGRVTIEHDDPLPCTILGLYGDLESGN